MKEFLNNLLFSIKIFIEIYGPKIDFFFEKVQYIEAYLLICCIVTVYLLIRVLLNAYDLNHYFFKKYFFRSARLANIIEKNASYTQINFKIFKDVTSLTKGICYSYYKELPLDAKVVLRFKQVINFFKKQNFKKPFLYDLVSPNYKIYTGSTKDIYLSQGLDSIVYVFVSFFLIIFTPIFYLNLQFMAPFFFFNSWNGIIFHFKLFPFSYLDLMPSSIYKIFDFTILHSVFKLKYFSNVYFSEYIYVPFAYLTNLCFYHFYQIVFGIAHCFDVLARDPDRLYLFKQMYDPHFNNPRFYRSPPVDYGNRFNFKWGLLTFFGNYNFQNIYPDQIWYYGPCDAPGIRKQIFAKCYAKVLEIDLENRLNYHFNRLFGPHTKVDGTCNKDFVKIIRIMEDRGDFYSHFEFFEQIEFFLCCSKEYAQYYYEKWQGKDIVPQAVLDGKLDELDEDTLRRVKIALRCMKAEDKCCYHDENFRSVFNAIFVKSGEKYPPYKWIKDSGTPEYMERGGIGSYLSGKSGPYYVYNNVEHYRYKTFVLYDVNSWALYIYERILNPKFVCRGKKWWKLTNYTIGYIDIFPLITYNKQFNSFSIKRTSSILLKLIDFCGQPFGLTKALQNKFINSHLSIPWIYLDCPCVRLRNDKRDRRIFGPCYKTRRSYFLSNLMRLNAFLHNYFNIDLSFFPFKIMRANNYSFEIDRFFAFCDFAIIVFLSYPFIILSYKHMLVGLSNVLQDYVSSFKLRAYILYFIIPVFFCLL